MGLAARRLAFLRQRLWSKRDILSSLIEKDWNTFLRRIRIPYLRDVHDHVTTMLHQLDAACEIVDTAQSTYLAIVQIDVAAAAHNGEKVMSKLSAAATIILPMSLFTGMLGMNVTVPAQADEPHPPFWHLTPFYAITALFGFICIGLTMFFRKKGYLY